MPYFLAPQPLTTGAELTLSGEEASHLLKARRIKAGERFALQGSDGLRFEAEMVGAERSRARIRIGEALPVPPPPPVRLRLLQAAVKERATEWIVQKATELGVAEIVFFPTAFSTVSHHQLAAERNLERWRRIAWEACKQCERQAPPELAALPGLGEALHARPANPGGAMAWLLEAETGVPPRTAPRLPPEGGNAELLVGPEGGLTPAEMEQARKAGFTAVRLGGQILRAETAALAGCALMLFGSP